MISLEDHPIILEIFLILFATDYFKNYSCIRCACLPLKQWKKKWDTKQDKIQELAREGAQSDG